MKKGQFFFFLIFLCSTSVFASSQKAGTSGAQFLKIGPGARPTAMGESFVAVADDIHSVYYNPAGLGSLEKSELTAMHNQWIEGLSYEFGALAVPFQFGTLGFSVSTLKADDLQKRDESEAESGNFETLDAAYGFSYGRKIGKYFSLGGTGRFIQQKIDTATAKSWGADVGILYRLPNKPLRFGLAVKNMGTAIKFNEESDPQPYLIDAGAAVNLINNKLVLAANGKKPRDNELSFGAGVEWKQELAKEFRFALRSGYNSSQTDADGATGLSMGAGLGLKQFDLDFAWVPLGDLGNTFRYSARLRF